MKLYEVPRNTRVKVLEDARIPPAALSVKKGDVLQFLHVDGMYSLCKNAEGETVHVAAWTEVEIMK
jgi:hypothetical protein